MKKNNQLKKNSVQNKSIVKQPETNQFFATVINSKTIKYWLILLVAVTAFVYSPTFKNQVNIWDDEQYIQTNPFFKPLTAENVKNIFTTQQFMGNYHPLTLLSLTIDYQIGGRDKDGNVRPFMFHFTNLLLHIITTLLVFWFVYLLFSKLEIALFVAFLFGVHTLHVESVAWVSERKDVLYSAFFVASLCFYVKYVREQKFLYIALSFMAFVLSLLSKGQAVSLAVTLIAIDFLFNRKLLSLKVIVEKIPYFVLALVFGSLAIVAQKHGKAILIINDYEYYKRFAFAGYGFTMYLVKLLLPFNLSAIYPYPDIVNQGVPTYYWLLLLPAVVFITSFLYFGKRAKEIAFGIAFFTINIFLLLQFVPVGNAVYADRYAYIPSIGIFVLAAFSLEYLLKWKRNYQSILVSIIGIYFVIISVLTFQRTQIWKSNLILWEDAATKEPKSPLAFYNLGTTKSDIAEASGNMNLYKEAILDFDKALQINPYYLDAIHNRGSAKEKMNDNAGAIADFDRYIQTDYNFHSSRNEQTNNSFSAQYLIVLQNRATVKGKINDWEGAIVDLDKSILMKPDNAEAYYNRGMFKDKLGDLKGAIADFDVAAKMNLTNAIVYRGISKCKLGLVLKNDEMLKEALADFDSIILKFPNKANVYVNRATAKEQMNDLAGSLADYDKAVMLDNKMPDTYFKRAIVKQKSKNILGAIDDFSKAIDLNPAATEYYTYRGIYLINNGQKGAGCKDLSTAAQRGDKQAEQVYNQKCK